MQGYFPGYSCVNRSFKNRNIKFLKVSDACLPLLSFQKRLNVAKTSLITGVDFSTESSNHHDGPFPLQQLVLE